MTRCRALDISELYTRRLAVHARRRLQRRGPSFGQHADDVVQEAVLRGLERIATGELDVEGAPAWIGGAVKVVAREAVDGRDPRNRLRSSFELLDDEPRALAPDPSDVVGDREFARRAVETFEKPCIGPHERRALIERYFRGRSIEDIAREEGVRPASVRQRIKRGRDSWARAMGFADLADDSGSATRRAQA